MNPGDVIEKLPDLSGFVRRKVAASGRGDRRVTGTGGSQGAETCNRKLRQTLDPRRAQRPINAELFKKPRPVSVLVVAAEDLPQSKLVHDVLRENVGLADHDLSGRQIDEALLVGRRGQRSGEKILAPPL